MDFNIEIYLNSLDENIEIIDVSYKKLIDLPDLSRFKNLKELNCSHNQLTYLPPLNKTLKKLFCEFNNLTYLPILNEELEKLHCSYNRLLSLPILNKNLKTIHCSYNRLLFLPTLNENLKLIDCSQNKLISLPTLNKKLKLFIFYNNKIHTIIKDSGYRIGYKIGLYIDNIEITRKIINVLNNFRYSYYCLKFKKQFRIWLWLRIREPKIRNRYHPKYILKNLDENTDLDNFLDNWIIN